METWQRITLVAAGAGAGIAATFNTPIGGVMFAIELMMPEISARTFLPVALATGTATFSAEFSRCLVRFGSGRTVPWRDPASLAALCFMPRWSFRWGRGRRLRSGASFRRGRFRALENILSAPCNRDERWGS